MSGTREAHRIAPPRSAGGIGEAAARREDVRLITGRGRFVGDIVTPGALTAVFVRSPHAHARIDRVDTAAAQARPAVVAVWTGADFAQAATTLRVAPPIEGLKGVDLPPFPVDKVRFAGDLVACVVAENARRRARCRRGGRGRLHGACRRCPTSRPRAATMPPRSIRSTPRT